ncbi:right-handed parallel beta-helix repeat-containing protein, partial [Methylotenera sp.]
PGDKVIFSAGEYRNELYLNDSKPWSADNPTIFIAEAPGKVIIKGSDVVQGWQRLDESRYSKDWQSEPSQVFVDGIALIQLGGTIFGGFPNDPASSYNKMHKENGGIWPGRISYSVGAEMPKDSFYFDKDMRKLIISVSTNPNQRKIEVSARRRPFFAERVSGIVLDGLVFEHSNTSVSLRGAAVTIIGNDNIIRNVKVLHADLAGIQTVGDRNQLLNSVANYSGQMGVTMRGTNNRVVGVDASYNNARGFNKWWEAGGFKFVGDGGLQVSEFIGNTAIGNRGDGIWFDWQNRNNLIQGNVSAYNSGFGIHYELSQSGVIQDNYVYGNGQRGIYLRDSANCWITHNLVIGNDLEGIVAVYTGQKDSKGVEFGAENTKVYSNIVGWNNGGALIMPKGASKLGEADGNVYLGSQKSIKFSLGYPATLSPAVYLLRDWNKISALDVGSTVGDMPIPNEISDRLTKKIAITNWSAIQNAALSLRKEKRASFKNDLLPGGQIEVVGPRKIK